jgi:glutamyl-tRNA synthetase
MAGEPVRVRFAPSPTGPLHIGGLRTALFNYLFAKKHKGTFILRIEDTDQVRYVPGAEEYIIGALRWAGIMPDEGIPGGGPHAPYRQSERKGIYREYAEKLVASGNAYYAFDTPGELEKIRKEYEDRKESFTYDAKIRGSMDNSIDMSSQEVSKRIEKGDHYVIRFRFSPDEEIKMNDLIRGEIRVHASTLDDKVLFKQDGMPTYHLANVVDDHLMKISHVIRGEEWLPSLPLHYALYKALGWDETMPQFAHLPLILKPDGKGKLSKRDGDRGGFPVFPLQWTDPLTHEVYPGYRESGYLPEACLNILALLGWNPGTEQEIFSLGEMISAFSLDKVGRSGSKFDPEKAKWFNHQYLQLKPEDELTEIFRNLLDTKGIRRPDLPLKEIINLVKERSDLIGDLWEHADFFFTAPEQYDEQFLKKRWKPGTSGNLRRLTGILRETDPFSSENIERHVMEFIETNRLDKGQLMSSWRITVVGSGKGPGLAQIAEILGRDEVIRRMNTAIEKIRI